MVWIALPLPLLEPLEPLPSLSGVYGFCSDELELQETTSWAPIAAAVTILNTGKAIDNNFFNFFS